MLDWLAILLASLEWIIGKRDFLRAIFIPITFKYIFHGIVPRNAIFIQIGAAILWHFAFHKIYDEIILLLYYKACYFLVVLISDDWEID